MTSPAAEDAAWFTAAFDHAVRRGHGFAIEQVIGAYADHLRMPAAQELADRHPLAAPATRVHPVCGTRRAADQGCRPRAVGRPG